ncbi:MAG: DUF4931 domain-containing protein [Patescibacteria group bacterium]
MDKLLNEFRQDLVSGDWVLFSTARTHSVKKFEDSYQPKVGCPFEDPAGTGHKVVWGYPDNDNWQIMVLENKFPAVRPGICGPDKLQGSFNSHDAIGDHDVIVYKDHDLQFSDFSVEEAAAAIKVYKKRYQEMAQTSECVEYVMIFHNYGHEAGASMYHPHSQIISMPILPPDVSRSIFGSHSFYEKNGKKVYDVIIQWEREEDKRIVYENDFFVAFCPFVSKLPYEVRIFSKDSHAHFEKMPDELDRYLADALLAVLKKIKMALGNPPFNFFIHTAPVKENGFKNFHQFYHWHIEIFPKLSILAGFELGTGMDINVINPDEAAKVLRNA